MRCLTVLNPYPVWIFLPASDEWQKRVENRSWATSYRGLLLIHAGKNPHPSFDPDGLSNEALASLHWGKIVGAVDLVECARVVGQMSALFYESKNGEGRSQSIERKYFSAEVQQRFPWLATHRHTEGDVCWVLENPRKFRRPVECVGRQGLFKLPDSLKESVLEQLKEARPL